MKAWLKDNAFAAGASASLTDLISGRISNEDDRRTARRIFADRGEPVVSWLTSLRRAEFG